jgi:hypothetical protein
MVNLNKYTPLEWGLLLELSKLVMDKQNINFQTTFFTSST